VVYASGFEQPTFVTGPINGQDGWSGSGDIQSAVVQSGNQALAVDARVDIFNGATQTVSYPAVGNTIVAEVDFRQSGSENPQSGLALFGNTGFLAQLDGVGGFFALGNSDSAAFGGSIAQDTWYHLAIVLDFQTDIMTGYVDGTSFATLPINIPTLPSAITSVQLFSYQGDQTVFFDNVSVTAAAPLPVTWAGGLALLGLVGIGRGRKVRA